MVTTVRNFLKDWHYEYSRTLDFFISIPEELHSIQHHPQLRSMGRLAWHLTQTVPEMMQRAGLALAGPLADDPMPNTMHAIADAYEATSESLMMMLPQQWNDAALQVRVDMYGEMWRRGAVLDTLVRHQAHHRGQLVVLMRLSGLTPLDVYGPTREAWAKMGMENAL